MTSSRTAPHRWRRAVAGMAIAAAAFSVTACGEDVVDDEIQEDVEQGVDDVEQEVEEGVDDAEQELEEGTDGQDEDG